MLRAGAAQPVVDPGDASSDDNSNSSIMFRRQSIPITPLVIKIDERLDALSADEERERREANETNIAYMWSLLLATLAECIYACFLPDWYILSWNVNATATVINFVGPFLDGMSYGFEELQQTKAHQSAPVPCLQFRAAFLGVFTSYSYMVDHAGDLGTENVIAGPLYIVATILGACVSFHLGKALIGTQPTKRLLSVVVTSKSLARLPSFLLGSNVFIIFTVMRAAFGRPGFVRDPKESQFIGPLRVDDGEELILGIFMSCSGILISDYLEDRFRPRPDSHGRVSFVDWGNLICNFVSCWLTCLAYEASKLSPDEMKNNLLVMKFVTCFCGSISSFSAGISHIMVQAGTELSANCNREDRQLTTNMDADSSSNKRLKMTAVVPDALVQCLHEKQQDHVLKFYNDGKLTAEETGSLVKQLEALDLDLLDSIFRASTAGEANTANKTANIEPLDEFDLLENCSEDDKQRWLSLGLEAISKGQVCALVMGGGQGTRLGFAGPKGMYNIGLPSERSLFQLFTERVLKLQRLAAATFPDREQGKIQLLVMTSVMNHDETVAYFRDHAYFGLDEQQMFFFPQGTLPCLTRDGKLMLENAHTLASASDGNGGIYKALAQRGGLARLQQRGVKYLHVFSVDNALCKTADPMFIGYCIAKNADCGNKVVWKSRANESVGVVAKKDGKFCVVEYSEMDKAASELTDATTGKLAFGAANICNHFFTTEFLSDVVLPNMSLEYHVAEKKIPVAGDDGVAYTPTTNSGIKLEAFIFDTFPLSSRMAVLAVPRETEFAPVKNAPGSAVDSPDTARQMIYGESKTWLLAAGEATLSKDECEQLRSQKLDAARAIEISPLVSFNGEGLESHLKSLCDGSSQAVIRVESSETPATRLSIPATIRQRFEDARQGHLFHFVDQGKVSAHDASVLVESIRDIDPASLNNLFERSTSADAQSQSRPDEIEPLEDGVVDILAMASADTKSQWLARGLDAVAKGMVAALVLAGGQGTRLGFAGPKGMYDIGLPSHKTLFEIFADRIRKVQLLAQDTSGLQETPRVPFLIMTSEMNHDDTASYFKANSYFGLDANQVHFFRQGTLPCFNMDGKIILETPSTVSRASDGNGGIYPALKRSGMLHHLETTNVQYLHVFSVDNVLCKVADPVFIGYCVANDADCANKVVWKSRPDESVGVFAKKNGKFCVVEYSELDTPSSELVDSGTGKLVFGAANICNHFYRLDFLKRCCALENLAGYHVAKKKIPFVDETTGSTIVPTTNSGIKLETFIFDVFQHATNMKVLGVEREDEFAPVKNAPGSATDSPDTARHLVSEQCKRWLLKAGATFDDESNGLCEVVASVSYDGEGLEQIATTRSPIKLPALIN